MDRTFSAKEQKRVHTSRAKTFLARKRKNSATEGTKPGDTISPPNPGLTSTSTSTTTTQSITMSSAVKRFKFPGMTSTKPAAQASKTPLIVRFYDANVQAKDAHGRTQEHILTWSDSKLESCHNYIQMLFPVPEGSAFNWEAPIIDRETMDTFRARSELRIRLRSSFERMLDFYGFEVSLVPEVDSAGEDEQKVGIKIKDESSGGVESIAQGNIPTKKAETATKPQETTDGELRNLAKTADDRTDESANITVDPTPETQSDSTASCGYHIIRAPHWQKSFRSWAVRFDHNHLRITRILRCLRILGLQTECDAFFVALKRICEDPTTNISERSLSYWTRAVTRPLYIAPDDDKIEWLQEWEEEQEATKEGVERTLGEADEEKGKGGVAGLKAIKKDGQI
jgi:hypothetical protein